MTGVYTIHRLPRWPAPVVVHRDVKYLSAEDLLITLVGNAHLSQRHFAFLTVIKRLRNHNEGTKRMSDKAYKKAKGYYERYQRAIYNELDPDDMISWYCAVDISTFEATKILDPKGPKLSALARQLSESRCWK